MGKVGFGFGVFLTSQPYGREEVIWLNVRHAGKHEVFVGVQGKGILKECVSALVVWGMPSR